MNTILWDIWTILQPIVTLLVATAGPLLVGWLAARLASWLRIEDDLARQRVESELRDALHHAAHNAMVVALGKLGPKAKTADLLIEAANYVYRANPDTIERLEVGQSMLTDILLSKLPVARTLSRSEP